MKFFPVSRFCRTERETAKGKTSSSSNCLPPNIMIIITIMVTVIMILIMVTVIMMKVAGWELDDPQYLAVCDNNRVFFECLLEQAGVII